MSLVLLREKYVDRVFFTVATELCLVLYSSDSHPFCLNCNQNSLYEKDEQYKQIDMLRNI